MIVFVLVLAAEADETRMTVTLLIGCLVGIAAVLSLLTVWYWFYTDPSRRPSIGERIEVELDPGSVSDLPIGPAGRSVEVEPDGGWGAAEAPPTRPRRAVASTPPVLAGPAPSETEQRSEKVQLSETVQPFETEQPPDERTDAEDGPAEVVAEPLPAAANAGGPPTLDEDGPVFARQTWDFVTAARRAEESGPTLGRPQRPAVPRIDVPDRLATAEGEHAADDGDELAAVRRRRERASAHGLSDEAWEVARRAVFDKLDG